MKPLRKTTREMLFAAVLALIVLMLSAIPVSAQVTGPCADCHTMHNSQNGTEMATEWDGTTAAGPFERLLKRDGCLGCHRGTYNSGGDSLASTPKVWNGSDPANTTPNNGLTSAGGNFYWVVSDDATGHNVVGVAGEDGAFTDNAPPGYVGTFVGPQGTARGPFAATDEFRLSCSGTYGCHGDPSVAGNFPSLSGAHHGVANSTAVTGINGFCDGTTLAKSYRFLYGIRGIEDDDWEYTVSYTDHNQYHGEDRVADAGTDNETISHLCCECHGNFHAADGPATGFGSPWIRHPTDFDMNNLDSGSEYLQYNVEVGAVVGDYSTLAPVGSDMSALTGVSDLTGEVIQNVFSANDKAIVTCISCHRAHGSEFDDILRWDYEIAGAHAASGNPTGSGCFVCHTTKDDN